MTIQCEQANPAEKRAEDGLVSKLGLYSPKAPSGYLSSYFSGFNRAVSIDAYGLPVDFRGKSVYPSHPQNVRNGKLLRPYS